MLKQGPNVLPADTDIPAPAMTTIFRFLCRTLSNRSNCACSLSLSSSDRRSRYSVVRCFGSPIRLFLVGGGPSSSPEAIPSGFGEPFVEVRCEEDGEGRPKSRGGEGDREAGEDNGELSGESEESESMTSEVGARATRDPQTR